MNTNKNIWAVIILAVATIISVALVSIFREGDNTAIITAIIGLSVPTIASILAYMKAEQTHLSVNSRLDGLVAASRAEGVVEGTELANIRTDKLAEKLK